MKNTLFTALTALVFGFLGAAAWSYAGLADNRTRSYLVENPEVLEEVAEALAAKRESEALGDARARLEEMGDSILTPFPGAVMGNPDGSKVLVEFSDYNCGYCEASLADIQQLVDADPDLKVVIREWPIFQGSDYAARMALAAGMQGKYREFHEAMFANGPATPESVDLVAEQIGLDMERAQADAGSEAVSLELARNFTFARTLGFTGTPGFIANGTPIPGAVGYERLKELLDAPQG